MGIKVNNYNFNGPYRNTDLVMDKSGVYVIIKESSLGTRSVVDVGESKELQTRLKNHDRSSCWNRQIHNPNTEFLSVAVLYCDQTVRMAVERELRSSFDPVCGIR